MMKFKPNQTRTYDGEGFKKRAACLCFKNEREDEDFNAIDSIIIPELVSYRDANVWSHPTLIDVLCNILVISNKYLMKQQSKDHDVEWGYAFDVHLNAFYPLLVILHFIQLFFINHIVFINHDWFIGCFFGNTLWLIAVGYYIYITFLGYSALPFLKNTVIMLYPFALLVLLYLLSLGLGWNFTKGLCWFYKFRVQ